VTPGLRLGAAWTTQPLGRRALRLEKYLPDRSAIPAPPTSWVVPGGGTYPYDANGYASDCIPAFVSHQIEAWQRFLGRDRIYTDAEILAWYEYLTGGSTTVGVSMPAALDLWAATGFPAPPGATPGADQDTLLAWAVVEPTDHLLAQTALSLFGGGGSLLGLPIDADTQRVAGEEWEVTTGPGAVVGSWGWHCALVSAYDADGVTFETWGSTQTASWAWWDAYCSGLYLCVSNDWAGDPMVDLAALEGDMRQLAGPASAAPSAPVGLVRGVDVSNWQGANINWATAKAAGVEVAFVQATEGRFYESPNFHVQVAGARAAGIKVGAYHMSHPSANSAQGEHDYFTAYVGSTVLDLPPMVDDEVSGGMDWSDNVAWHKEFLALCGAGAFHYCNEYYLENMGPLGRQWTARPGATALAAGDFAVQYSLGSAEVGFPGAVDLDAFNPAILGAVPPPPPPPQEGKMLVVFYAKNVHGTIASFAGDGLTAFRWLESAAQHADALAVGAVAGSKAPRVWNAPTAPVADPMAFGTPANAATAAELGLPFP
jgi:hypothetical protein